MTVFSVVLALLLSGVEPQTLQTFDPNKVEAVDVRNNRRFPSDTIKYTITTKPGDVFSVDVIRADMRRLYALGYFDSVTTYEEEGKTGKIVVFYVVEKPVIRSIEYKGAKSITR